MMKALVLSGWGIKADRIFFVLLITIALAGGVFAFPLSYLTNTNELIGLCLIPFVVTIQGNRRVNYIFLSLFLLFGIGSFILGVRMFYFFALSFYVLWLAELFFGEVNILVVFLLGFMSPVFYQVSAILGFPIRLEISRLAGVMLEWIGMNIQVEGNIMLLNGSSFAVDDACMGLNMLATSMLMGVFILAHNCKRMKKALKMRYLLLFFSLGFALNIVSNLFRIVIIVLFKIMPESSAHEITGVICLCIYVLIPLYFMGHWMVDKVGARTQINSKESLIGGFAKLALLAFSLMIMMTGIRLDERRARTTIPITFASIAGYDKVQLADGVTKMTNAQTLIYIKPIQEFFSGEHTPLICWKGSGYTFNRVAKTKMGDNEIYCGQLVKGQEKLFTAWWYTNGNIQTISQLEWRWRMMKGEEKFSLVNVTAATENELQLAVKTILKNDLIKMK